MKFGETLVLLGIFVVLPTIIVWLVLRYKKHETDKRAEMALAAIEKDSDLNLEAFFRKMNPPSRTIKEKLLDKLLWGCIFTIFGVCIYMALAVFGMVIDSVIADIILKTKCSRYIKRSVTNHKTKRLFYGLFLHQ